MNQLKLSGACLLACAMMSAQTTDENAARMAAGAMPIYRVSVTAKTAKAINYRHRSGATKVDFRGTSLLPGSRGEAKVESKQGYIEIEVEFDNLKPANSFGAEYLTYVMWAITPEGRAANLGEVLLNGTKSKLNVTTELQAFGLVITAEPYYAVSRPSDLVVMENVVRKDTVGKIEEIDAKYELLQRGQYERLANPLALKLNPKLPLELYEARNAVQIARAVGADRFATDSFQKAEKSLSEAEAYQARKAGKKPVVMTARQAVQTAEDSRAIAVKRQEADALVAERQQSAERELRAESGQAAAKSETVRVTQEAEAARLKASEEAVRQLRNKESQTNEARAELDRVNRENASRAAAADVDTARLKADAERLKAENDARIGAATLETARLKLENDSRSAAATAEAERTKAESDAKLSAATSETARLKLENDSRSAAAATEAGRLKADSDARIGVAVAETERLKRENYAQKAASEASLDNAARQNKQLELEKSGLRVRLLQQFNAILETRDTARGLIVNMADVLFDTGKYSLRPLAREKLAKVAGIVAGHPGLKLDVEGHTDSVGGDEYNQNLSEQRGASVRNFLTHEGMNEGSVTTKGFGKTQPVATNDTAEGRQQNRRVELVISGELIGHSIGVPVASR